MRAAPLARRAWEDMGDDLHEEYCYVFARGGMCVEHAPRLVCFERVLRYDLFVEGQLGDVDAGPAADVALICLYSRRDLEQGLYTGFS
jgi:hypothetical protein